MPVMILTDWLASYKALSDHQVELNVREARCIVNRDFLYDFDSKI